MIRAVLLDKDGTLTDFRATWEAWLGEAVPALAAASRADADLVAAAFGYDRALSRIAPGAPFVTAPESVTALGVALAVGWTDARAARWIAARARDVPQVPVPGAARAVAEIAAHGIPVGVLTNARQVEAERQLRSAGILEHLVRVIGCDSGYGAKPDPRGAAAFADALGIARAEVVLVGDGLPDIAAARGAGLRALGVLTGTLDAAALLAAGAEAVLRDVSHLPRWLADPTCGARAT